MTKRILKQPWQVAALIAEMMRRSKTQRARLSEKTLKSLAGRVKLESSIRTAIKDDVADYGYLLYPLGGSGPTRGNAVIAISALHAAKSIKAVDTFNQEELTKIRSGKFDFDQLHVSLLGEGEDDDSSAID